MKDRPALSGLLDVAVSLAAITLVLGACFASTRISMDFRAIFALTCAAFFLAGILRGASTATPVLWQAVRLSIGGLLGIAALILNNGLHRIAILASLLIGAYLSTFAGVVVRRSARDQSSRSHGSATAWLLLAIAATVFGIPKLSAYSAYSGAGKTIAPFVLSFEDRTVSSSELRGRVVVLAFWASWCANCYLELSHVADIYREFSSNPGVSFYFVDTGWAGETAEKGRSALARHQLDVPMAFDSGEAAKSFNVDALPAMVLIDKTGALHSVHRGYDASEDIEQTLRTRIRELLNQ